MICAAKKIERVDDPCAFYPNPAGADRPRRIRGRGKGVDYFGMDRALSAPFGVLSRAVRFGVAGGIVRGLAFARCIDQLLLGRRQFQGSSLLPVPLLEAGVRALAC